MRVIESKLTGLVAFLCGVSCWLSLDRARQRRVAGADPLKALSCMCLWSGLLLLGVPADASDFPILFPSGLQAWGMSEPHSASPTGYAVVAYTLQNNPNIEVVDHTLVIQAGLDGTTHTTEFAGAVARLSYSRSGEYLLVLGSGADGTSGATSYLLDNNGTILWTKPGILFFSTTGEVIYSWQPGAFFGDGGNTVELFSLAGLPFKTVTMTTETADIRGVVVPGNGQNVIFLRSRAVAAVGANSTTAWRWNVPESYPDIMSVDSVGTDRFVAHTTRNVDIVLNVNGSLEYTYDPQALGDADPWLGPVKYAGYRFYEGLQAGQLLLYDGTSAGQILDVATSTLTRKVLPTNRPGASYKVGPNVVRKHLFFFSSTGVVVRDIP